MKFLANVKSGDRSLKVVVDELCKKGTWNWNKAIVNTIKFILITMLSTQNQQYSPAIKAQQEAKEAGLVKTEQTAPIVSFSE